MNSAKAETVTQELESICATFMEIMGPDGLAESVEVASLRESLALARSKIEAFKSREDTVKSLLKYPRSSPLEDLYGLNRG